MAWMALIFSASTDLGAARGTSRIIGPILHWLKPDLSPETTERIVFAVRKTAHITEYGLLAVLLWRALRKPFRGDPRPWSWAVAGQAVAVAVVYAGTDEFHQAFVPSRTGSIIDVLWDSTGAAVGLIILWLLGRRLNHW